MMEVVALGVMTKEFKLTYLVALPKQAPFSGRFLENPLEKNSLIKQSRVEYCLFSLSLCFKYLELKFDEISNGS